MPSTSINGVAGPVGTFLHKFGVNPDVDSGSVPEDIWDGTTQPYPWLAAAGAAQLVSTSGLDTAGGTGVQSVSVSGCQGPVQGFAPFTEVVTMAGAVPVVLATPNVYRVNRMFGVTAGVTSLNQGIITCSVGGTTISLINVGRGQTLQAIYTVPLGSYRRKFLSWFASVTRQAATALEMVLYTREPGGPWRVRNVQGLNAQGSTFFDYGFAFREAETDVLIGAVGTDVRVTCVQCTTINTQINAGFVADL